MKVFDIKQIKIRVLALALTLIGQAFPFSSQSLIQDAKAKNSDPGEVEEAVF
jgi:hypothetical protein